jgi:hypothetical protein
MEERRVRGATLDDARWIVDLSARVQESLTASGSRQQIGPLLLESTERSILVGNAFLLETAERHIGSVLVDPLDNSYLVQWGLHSLAGLLWYLHSLMLEPEEQGKRLGLIFLEDVKQLMAPLSGTIVLDCWAGNAKLRDFYHRAGFTFHGIFPVKDYEVAVFIFSLTPSL